MFHLFQAINVKMGVNCITSSIRVFIIVFSFSMILFGVKFAPLMVPLERRLQTLAAGMWFIILAFGGFAGAWLSVYLLLYTRYYTLVLLYYLWIYLDRQTCETGGRR